MPSCALAGARCSGAKAIVLGRPAGWRHCAALPAGRLTGVLQHAHAVRRLAVMAMFVRLWQMLHSLYVMSSEKRLCTGVSDLQLQGVVALCRRERKIYFEKLDVAAIRCNLTLIPRPGQRGEAADPVSVLLMHFRQAFGVGTVLFRREDFSVDSLIVPGLILVLELCITQAVIGAASRFRLANVFGIHFSDVHALPLRVGSLTLSHAFVTLNQLTSQIGRHLLWTVRIASNPCPASPCAWQVAVSPQ